MNKGGSDSIAERAAAMISGFEPPALKRITADLDRAKGGEDTYSRGVQD